jgi:hypothetical protein
MINLGNVTSFICVDTKYKSMKKLLAFTLASFFCSLAFSQNEVMTEYANTITQEDLKELLTIIASDAMEGRETGERGQKMAAAFIADHFERLGLEAVVPTAAGNSYYQKFNLERRSPGMTFIDMEGKKLENGIGTLYYGNYNSDKVIDLKTVYVGDGSETAFSEVDVSGKAAVMSNTGSNSEKKEISQRAYDNGAEMVFIINAKTETDWTSWINRFGKYYMRGSLGFAKEATENASKGIFFVSPVVGAKLLNSSEESLSKAIEKVVAGDYKGINKIKSGNASFLVETNVELVGTENVLGYLEGTDKKEELVILTAHYDHIGRRGEQINNGADDDGSGTSSILEIAEAFVEAKKAGNGPRRSMLFMTVTGEEKGLLGSEYYSDHPIFPLENTIVDLNIDMVGRVDAAHEDDREFIYLVGSDRLSSELHELSEKVNETFTHLSIDYTYNDEKHPDRIYYRSDHWNFARKNIPIIFYFNGTHDDYHQPTDTVDKIEFDLLEKRAQLVYYTAWVIANRDTRLVVDKLSEENIAGSH